MAFMKVEQGSTSPNFLESEVGLVLKTEQLSQANATTDGTKKFIYGGTIYPANDSTATGIVFETVDMTDDTVRPASVIKAGRIYEGRLKDELATEAKTALAALGFIFCDAPETTF